VTLTVDPTDPLGWIDASYHVARTIRDALLVGTPWPTGTRWYGRAAWPFSASATPVVASSPDYAALAGRHVMVIGCGSVGSEAMRALVDTGARWTVIDDATVTVFNLARQWYGAEEVGRPKVLALQQRLGGARVRAWRTQLETRDLPALETLLRADPPDVTMLATGTHHHAMIGQLLWRLGIPHVSAHCYPQARFFEISIVSPRERTPCLHCFRGHLDRGAPEPAPITDEVARFLYRPISDGERARLYTDLVAEPATRIETMRAAAILARAALELCATRRSAWFDRALAAGTTCLLGGNIATRLADGSFAYGIREAGQVIRLGLEDLAESVDCSICRRRVTVAHQPQTVVSTDGDADAALL
ncbi:MAG TPA: ThiF family adenylyltransferase, partial [Kofleriaceae bacterium]